jgi:hypothetical protein
MSDECVRLDELDSLLDLDPRDPRRRHLESCPLCRARLAAYKAFIAEGPPQPGSEPGRADAELAVFMEKMIHGGVETEAGGGFLARLRGRRLPRRALIPGVAAAAVAAVILVIALNPFPDGDGRYPAPLRGLDSMAAGSTLSIQPAVARDGTVLFSWTRLPDADRYEAQIFDTNLKQIARFEADRGTSLTVRVGDIPKVDGPLFWRVMAFREGDEIAHSRLLSFDLDAH